MKNLSFTLLLLMGILSLNAQIVVNEFSASNLHSFLDNYDKTEDWIELYNTSDTEQDISGYFLSDKAKKPGKWEIPAATIIPAKGFMVFWCSGRDEVKDNNYHTNFKLSQTSGKDKVIFADRDKNILEIYDMNFTLVEHSMCRSTDGDDAWSVCTNPSLGTTNNGTNQFERYTATPSMSLKAGFYDGTQSVSIVNNEPNSIMRYTIDGTNPISSSLEYTSPISITKTMVLKALSFSNDATILPGKMDFNTYFIDEDYSLAVYSVAADQVLELANGNGELIPIGSIEYFNKEEVREATSFGDLNRHGQDSWILDHRSIDWASRDEMGYSKAVNAPLFSYSDRDEYQKFMFRNSGDDNYPANDDADHVGSTHIRDEYVQELSREGGMHLDTRAVERVILFLNGKYWGLYGMRERPVDHDYTKEYYKQGKYDLHFLTTWATTKAQYGGDAAFEDWYQIRDFILNKDMSNQQNYDIVDEQIDLISLSDYFIANQAVVAKDWLNYNTGWWRGLKESKKHTKWGYLLWDMDATFDYYINYTGIPNDQPDAKPCDIQAISESMDQFFGGQGGGGGGEVDPESCNTIINSTCPYPVTDTIFLQVINQDNYCCESEWDQTCQSLYDNILNMDNDTCATILNGSCPYTMDDPLFQQVIGFESDCCSNDWNENCQEYYNSLESGGGTGENGEERSGNIGKHEKILIKLLEESPDFQQLYYSRYADMMNTVYSCENMNETLDRMLDVIRPEMPRQIARWGGSMAEWEANVEKLKTFVNERCELLDDGMIECYSELSGPYNITLVTSPAHIGAIKLNTLKHKEFPWSGSYFGGMTNKIKASLSDEEETEYKFSHWETTSASIISPDVTERSATIALTTSDTLKAVFKKLTDVEDLNLAYRVEVYPNPTSNSVNISYSLGKSSVVSIQLYSILGEYVSDIGVDGLQSKGEHTASFNMSSSNLAPGIYTVQLSIDNKVINKKLTLLK